jgi:5-formyltetrahydrofolate cyclo-ligase
MNKKEVRKVFLQKRESLTEAQWQSACLAIYNTFFASVDLSFVGKLHIYLPIEGKREADTWQIIDKIRREHPAVRLIVPKIDKGRLSHFYFEGLHQIKTNTWGIPEPTQGIPAEPFQIDMVIAPLLAADTYGNRVGYGKGFYDRFLKECKPKCKKIGLSLFPLIEQIDVDEFDVALDAVVLPDKFLEFKHRI